MAPWAGVSLGNRWGKKKGAIHAPVRCASGLGLAAVHGHLKLTCHPDLQLVCRKMKQKASDLGI